MENEKLHLNRRSFVKSAAILAVAAPQIIPSSVLGKGKTAPSDKINLGLIGCGALGKANLNACLKRDNVVLTAACDVWNERLDPIVERHKHSCKGYTDYRDLLLHPGLDAVIIATPAHWHALQAIEAAEAGLHIYLQKPMTMHLGESLAVRNAIRKYGVICQIGTQIHAHDHYRRMVELVRSGNLGDIATIRTFFVMNQAIDGIGKGNNTNDVPAGLDWNKWVGPARMQPFNPNVVKDAFHHCFWMDFSGGWTPGMAPHIIDLPIWALNLGYPTEVSAMGGRYVIDDDGDAYDNHEVLWKYPSLTMSWMQSSTNSHGWAFQGVKKEGVGYETDPQRRLGIYFHGSNGTLITDYSSHILIPEGNRMDEKTEPAHTIPSSPGQELEWLDCIKSGNQPLCNVDYHVKIDVAVNLSVLSMKLGRSIKFDPVKEEIIGDRAARRMAIPEYRRPWKFPSKYL